MYYKEDQGGVILPCPHMDVHEQSTFSAVFLPAHPSNHLFNMLTPAEYFRAQDDTRAIGFDIALVRMDTAVTLDRFTRPASLWNGGFPFNFRLDAVGFGRTCRPSTGRRCTAQSLGAARMLVVSDGRNVCVQPPRRGSIINPPPAVSLVCAIPQDGITCSGDSGGYLGGTDSNGVHLVVGVTSFGDRNCETDSAFSSVTHYFNWIMSIGG